MKIKFTANARRRLSQILDYQGSKKGRKTTRSIAKGAKKLEDFPHLGQVEEQLKEEGKGHRYLLVGSLYKIIYFIAKPFIYITDIFDTRQDSDKMKP